MDETKVLELLTERPLVSVVMPAYNAEKYIGEAVGSVLAQSYTDWELIIINDCSCDRTAEIAGKYSALDPRVSVFHGDVNMGVLRSRAVGTEMSRGEWIAFLDADDRWENDKLEKQLYFAQSKNAGFTYTASSFMDEEGKAYRWTMNVPEVSTYKSLLKQNVISCSSVLIKKNLLLYNISSEKGMHEDFALWLGVLKKGNIAYGLDLPLLRYRISKNSKSGNKIKSAIMTYRTYRAAGLSLIESVLYMFFYASRGVKKYKKILRSGRAG